MKKTFQELKFILKSQAGVALMMILTAILLLMGIYGEFTFDSKISRLKATNILDRSQAKLLAESGLQLAMTRLQLYKEAFNKVESNQNAKQAVPANLLNQLWEIPFIFPIPVGKDANRAFRDTVEKFEQETLLEGNMRVTIQNISNRLNLNMLRVDAMKMDMNDPNKLINEGVINTDVNAIQQDVSVDQALYTLLKRLVDEKKDKDEGFADRYANLEYQDLISNLRFFISDYQTLASDPNAGEAEQKFQRIPLSPKYGPMGSSTELYAIPGWTDELIELIQNEFSVYPSAQIDLNKLTSNMLRLLIPTIQDDQIQHFFEYRDDPEQPKFFNTLDDFKKWATEIERVVNPNDFDARMELFKKSGISFGSNPNLFKVVSEGSYNRSTYTLVAYVYMPKVEPAAPNTNNPNGQPNNPNNPQGLPQQQTTPDENSAGTPGTATAQPTQLLEPRIIEIQIN